MDQASTSPAGIGLSAGGVSGDSVPRRWLRLPAYTTPSKWVLLLFLVWVWARYIQIGARGGGILGAVRFEFVLGVVLVLLSIYTLLVTPLEVRRSRNVITGIALLFLVMIIQVPFAAFPQLAQDVFVDRVIKFAFLALFMSVLIRSPKTLKLFLIVWMISIFWVTQEAVRGLISGALIWENQGVMRLSGAVPIYRHPNSLGGVAMGAVPFIVFLWPIWYRWWQRLLMLSLLGTSLICVVYSGSRTAYVALVAFLLFWFARSDKKARFAIIAIIAIPLTLLVVPDQYIERFKSIGGEEAEGNSKETRKQILSDAWAIFLDNPAGVGLGCFPVVRTQVFGRTQYTHNLYLEIATNIGLQGFLVFALFVYSVMSVFFVVNREYQTAAKLLKNARGRKNVQATLVIENQINELRFLAAVANAGAGFVFVRLVLGAFGMDLFEVYWWFGAGLAICLAEIGITTKGRCQRICAMVGASSEKI